MWMHCGPVSRSRVFDEAYESGLEVDVPVRKQAIAQTERDLLTLLGVRYFLYIICNLG